MRASKNEQERKNAFDSIRLGCGLSSLFGAALLFAFAGAAWAELPNRAAINRVAQNTYCSEAKVESSELRNGIVSYKHVVEVASNRALVEHPNVYGDSYSWKAKIVALLDQQGDDPGVLCQAPQRTHEIPSD